jgi:hypothetical protein
MSYLFCAFVYDRKRFDPDVIVEIMKERYKPLDKHEAFVKVPVKGTVDAIFMLPLRKKGLKSEAYFEWIEFLDDNFVGLLHEAVAAGRGAVSPRLPPVVFAVAYCDMSPHNRLWKVSPEGIDYRSVIDDEGCHVWIPTKGDPVERREDISVDPADFGATEESEENFREDEYHAEVARREQSFSPAAVLQEELRLTTARLIDAVERLEEGEKIWPDERKATVKKVSTSKKKGPAAS